jgi:hypothetical protein
MPSGRCVATSSTEFVSIYRHDNIYIYIGIHTDDDDDDVYIRDRKRAPSGIGGGRGGGIAEGGGERIEDE